jgi:lipopolysaccharide/colanic/teichoic acid biosynthesis glycosyltransferase
LTQQITTVTDGLIQPRTAGRSAALPQEITRRLVHEIEARGWQARSTRAFAVKRLVDVVVAASLSVIVVPVVLLLAAVGAVHFRANPFFTQTRLGQHGEEFTILKLRSLPPETGAYLLKESLGQQELSWFSRFLRGTKLDELPQLLHVLTGKMTLVGPRPKMPDRFEPVAFAYAHARTRVPQGCTCLWQVGVTTDGLPSETPEFDYFYLLHGGPRLDLWIVMRTALTLLGLARPVSLDDIPEWARGDGWIEPAVADDEDADGATVAA